MKFYFLIFSVLIFSACSSLIPRAEPESLSVRDLVLHKKWVRSTLLTENTGYRQIQRSKAVVAGNYVAVGNSLAGISVWNTEDGKLIWNEAVQGGVEGGIAIYKNRVYAGSGRGDFFAFDLDSGRKLWTTEIHSEIVSAPIFDPSRGRLFVTTSQNNLVALEADTGRIIWSFSRPENSTLAVRGTSQPHLVGGKIFYGSSDGALIAVEAEKGAALWEVQINRGKKFRDMDFTVLSDGDKIYAAGFDDRLICLNLSGQILWTADGGGYSDALIDGQWIYYPTTQGQIKAIDKDSGVVSWTYETQNGTPSGLARWKNDLVFGESHGSLVVFDPRTRKEKKRFEPGRGILATPTVAGSNIYFISNEGNLYSLDLDYKIVR